MRITHGVALLAATFIGPSLRPMCRRRSLASISRSWNPLPLMARVLETLASTSAFGA